MTDSLTVMQSASKFTELSHFVLEFVVLERMKMRRFVEGLALYIHHQLASQPIHTYQDLYEQAAEMEQVKFELRALNPDPNNQKRKWAEQGALSNNVNQNQKKPTLASTTSRPIRPVAPFEKCKRTNHTTPEVEWELINTCSVVAWNTSLSPVRED